MTALRLFVVCCAMLFHTLAAAAAPPECISLAADACSQRGDCLVSSCATTSMATARQDYAFNQMTHADARSCAVVGGEPVAGASCTGFQFCGVRGEYECNSTLAAPADRPRRSDCGTGYSCVARAPSLVCADAQSLASCRQTNAPNNCTFDAGIGTCFDSVAPCAASANCATRANCVAAADGTCAEPAALVGCRSYASSATCPVACFWDAFGSPAVVSSDTTATQDALYVLGGRCVGSVAETTDMIANSTAGVVSAASTGAFTCAHWSLYLAWTGNADVCLQHGCLHVGSACVARQSAPLLGAQCDLAETSELCRQVRSFCRYDWLARKCVNGLPQTCEQAYEDADACGAFGAPGTCSISLATGRCTTSPPPCAAIVDPGRCARRSDCSLNTADGSCRYGPTACGLMRDRLSCTAATCFWDPAAPMPLLVDLLFYAPLAPNSTLRSMLGSGVGAGQCFNSLAEVAGDGLAALRGGYSATPGTFGCSQWSTTQSFTRARDLCRLHGCTRIESISDECVAFAALPDAAYCSQLPSALDQQSELACFGVNAFCHWDARARLCRGGAPLSCEQFEFDAAGCAAFNGTAGARASGSCGWNVDNGRCFSVPACAYVGNAASCNARIDCLWSAGTCGDAAPLRGCGSLGSVQDCTSGGCVWDPFLTVPQLDAPSALNMTLGFSGSTSDSAQLRYAGVSSASTPSGMCFGGMSEVVNAYACAHWSYYFIDPSSACRFHGCAFEAAGAWCGSANATSLVTNYVVATDMPFRVENAAIGSAFFTADVIVPFASFWQPAAPVRYVIAIGTTSVSAVSRSGNSFLSVGTCTSANADFSMPAFFAPSTRSDTDTLEAEFSQQLVARAFGVPNATLSLSVAAVVGNWNIAPVAGNLIQSMTRRADLGNPLGATDSVVFGIRTSNLACDIGAGVSSDADGRPIGTSFVVPITVIQITSTSVSVASQRFNMQLQTHGTVTTSAATNAALRVVMLSSEDSSFLLDANGTQAAACAAGSKARRWTIQQTYANYDAAWATGIQRLDDVRMSSAMMPAYANCYGTQPLSLTAVACDAVRSECVTRISFQTVCVATTPAGDSFSACANSLQQPTQAARGTQTFFDFPRMWRLDGTASVYAGMDDHGLPDTVAVTINFPTFPDVVRTYRLTAQLALLKSPGGLDVSVGAYAARGVGSYINNDFTPVVSLTDAVGMSGFTLFIDLSSIVILPLSAVTTADGNYTVIADRGALNWTQIAPYVTKTVRSVHVACAAARVCELLDIAKASLYADGFNVPVPALRALMPANGYQLTMAWNAYPSTGGAARRLLDAQTQQGVVTMRFMVGSAADPVVPPVGALPFCLPPHVPLRGSTLVPSHWSFWSALALVFCSFASAWLVTYNMHCT